MLWGGGNLRYQFRSTLLARHQYLIFKCLSSQTSDVHFQNLLAAEYDSFPVEVMQYVRCRLSSLDANYDLFLSRLLGKSLIGVVLGKRGSGKTALMMSLAEVYHSFGLAVCAYNVSGAVPSWIQVLEFDKKNPYFDLPNNCFCFHDECHLDIDSKNWNSEGNNKVRRWVSTSRHRGQSIFYSSQIASNISLDLMKYADVKLFKPMNRANDEQDRADYLRRFALFYPERFDECLADVGGELFYFRNSLPVFWSKEISEVFK